MFERVCDDERTGYYETTYWFEDDTPLQVLNYNVEPGDEEGAPDTYDHTISLRNGQFSIEMIGMFSGAWSYELEKYSNPTEFLRWLECHPTVSKTSGTE
ncbi:MAG: hypothetical protein CMK32_00565 [Porticoccaceae bacterium]|nr:hypothetical protein [Porticoccaceae bacterium]